MLRPAARRLKKPGEKINLVPILDAVFIFIFYLLASSQFVKMYELASDVPTISDQTPPPQKNVPLNLTVKVYNSKIDVLAGEPQRTVASIRNVNKEYNLDRFYNVLFDLKKKYIAEESVILEPGEQVNYQKIIVVMDTLRDMRPGDGPFTKRDKETGELVEVTTLFSEVIFGNLEEE